MRLASVFVIASLAPSSVMAADLGPESVQVPAAEATAYAFSWTGPEFGLFGGGNWTNADFSTGGASFLEGDHKGGHVGAFAGYQYQFNGGIVLGVEGDMSNTWNKKTYSAFDDETGTDLSGSVRARVGYGFDRLLIYATGGWVMTRGYIKTPGAAEETSNFNGYTIGAGVDYAVTDKIFARAEYRFNDFQSDKIADIIDAKLDQHMVNLGIGMKF